MSLVPEEIVVTANREKLVRMEVQQAIL